ncbi:MAG: hypothetical protein J1E99_05195 [Muribaculaceae bacterium]|nr:hypothetical protein [Muribaculaceae bacterium]
MKVRFSREFAKAFSKLSGKMLESARRAVNEVIDATSLDDITDCKKLVGMNNVYRIRIGNKRAFFVLHVFIDDEFIVFEYLVNRGEAYTAEMNKKLRKKDT